MLIQSLLCLYVSFPGVVLNFDLPTSIFSSPWAFALIISSLDNSICDPLM